MRIYVETDGSEVLEPPWATVDIYWEREDGSPLFFLGPVILVSMEDPPVGSNLALGV